MVHAKRPSLLFLSETLAQPNLLESLRTRMGFAGCIAYPCEEDSQGVALFWMADVPVRLKTYSPHHIDAEVGVLGSPEVWRFTGIYGYATRSQRWRTWELIRALAVNSTLPWLVVGDFNEVACRDDKSGGRPRAAAPMRLFRTTMAEAGLLDMGYYGSRFTWSNRYTKERLDRAFQCARWRDWYSCSRAVTLPPNESDHSPILVEVSAERLQIRRTPRQFRFEEMWAQHQDCKNIINQGWSRPSTGNPLNQVALKIVETGKQLMTWHRGVFEHAKIEMRLIQEKMDEIMRQPFSEVQYEEHRQLHTRYSELLAQQETYWRQRSRVLWLKDGDRNSAFFHRRASNRKCRNRIKGLQNNEGQWCAQPETIQAILLEYYEEIYKSAGVDEEAIQEVLAGLNCRVTSTMNAQLLSSYSDEEIKKALFQMHPSKSPGPDGMSPFSSKNIGIQ
ncbi:uncharacterized protein LOC133732898 [Rosa rugosa]|uniref:uncharacterized protein LOC133732898 n=1 Tax=Rosa rugosa TaxID=74645 RepID=UPI002B41647C|nr:uncharacterized protein LOC133732898 [Rosa rugosa]